MKQTFRQLLKNHNIGGVWITDAAGFSVSCSDGTIQKITVPESMSSDMLNHALCVVEAYARHIEALKPKPKKKKDIR